MLTDTLPKIREDIELELPHFPTRMQAVIFRLWEMVPAARLAEVLETDEAHIRQLAQDMALPPQKNTGEWMEKGYITIIRSAWYLLPYEQLLKLLDWDAEQLAYILKEDDFLDIKLGSLKPACEPVRYRELNEEERRETKRLREVMERYIRNLDGEDRTLPFAFFEKKIPPEESNCVPKEGGTKETESDPGTVCPNDKWVLDADPKCLKSEAVKQFFDDFHIDYGFTFTAQDEKNPVPEGRLTLRIHPEWQKEREYHELTIEKHRILIEAKEPDGIFRGLLYMEALSRSPGRLALPIASYRRTPSFTTRFIYSYCGIYGNAFDVPVLISYPEQLMKSYARLGINGVWLPAVLYKMTPFPFEPALSDGWQERMERLNELIALGRRYGIRIYLYLNEPRSMPLSFFEKYPELKGHTFGENASLCTQSEGVQRYIADAVKTLCEMAPGLGGFFTITRSENHTNCYSHVDTKDEQECPRCRNKEPWEVVAELNSLIARTARSVDPSIQVFAWTWSWSPMGNDGVRRCIEASDPGITLMCTNEEHLDYTVGPMKEHLRDYTLSRIGPSVQSRTFWDYAKANGHATAAKVQLNNTWEASTAPYIPVYENILKIMRNLKELGVENLMVSWTLGGYPSENLKFASSFFFEEENKSFSYEEALNFLYQEKAPAVSRAVHKFCEAFSNYPFYVESVYNGPHNAGPSNLLYGRPTGLKATMTCYAFDDLDSWRTIFEEELYEDCFRQVAEGWQEGMTELAALEECEFKDIARMCGILFTSSYNQIRFIRIRDGHIKLSPQDRRLALTELAKQELKLAVTTYRLMLRNPSIGYEAANHYYFNRSMLMEKVINCADLIRKYEN